jgi:TetR/AcrR family transcriptional regulator, transcriptional repressor for nem operon
MTRYGKDHKARTRRSIVSAAASTIRAEGIEGARVSDVMRDAGLTHGGFYSHFDSKDELVAEACASGVVAARESLLEVAAATSAEARVRAMLDAYLTSDRRDRAGCTLATLGGEIARQPAAVRARFTQELEKSLAQLAPAMNGADEEHRVDQVIALVSAMVGAMMLSRAVSDRALSERILDVGRRALGGAVEWAGGATVAVDRQRARSSATRRSS